MPRGDNLRAGQPDGDRGRAAGGKARCEQQNTAVRDWPCPHWLKSQCWGHQGFRAVMDNHPTALSSLRTKIKETGRDSSRSRWRKISR
jgi:hypothetical protein